jgi:spermidine/putrescine transport system permease protein
VKKPRIFPVYIGVILIIVYLPVLLVIIYSFNQSRLSSLWSGFSLRWYKELFLDSSMFEALGNSLVLGILASLCSGIIGTLGAAGMARRKLSKAGKTIEYLSILPVMTPEIILGIGFLAFFSFLAIPAGMTTLLIAHTSFCVPYVYLLVKARLAGLDRNYIEAARIMGASDIRAFYDITLPLVLPAVISGMLISFAMSFDDVIISVFTAGVHTNTLPMKIYSQIKTGVTPKTNAMCTLIFLLTVLLCLASAALSRMNNAARSGAGKFNHQGRRSGK